MARFVIAALGGIFALLLVVAVLILVLPLGLFNFSMRVIERRLRKVGSPTEDIITFEPEVGWKPHSNLRTSYLDIIGDRCTLQTDAEGWPGRHSIEESDVVVFGDSFVFGYGSPEQSAYYSLARDCRIKAIGAPGYNMVQVLMWMRRYAPRLRGKLVIWCVCMENDLAENLKPYNPLYYTNPYLRQNNGSKWEIVTDHVRKDRWRHGDAGTSNVTLFAYLCTEGGYATRVFSAVRYLIEEARNLCETHGARLQILSIPFHMQLSEAGLRELRNRMGDSAGFDPGRPEARLAEICDSVGLGLIKGSSFLNLSDYKRRDTHWNLQGNQKTANVIASAYRALRYPTASPTQ